MPSMRKVSTLIVVGAAALGFGFGYGLYSSRRDVGQTDLVNGTLLIPPKAIVPFRLIDHHHRPFENTNFENHWSFVFFGFTHCPDICPTTLHSFRGMVELLQAKNKASMGLQVIFVSLDPERDTTERLREYIPFFHDSFLGVTGDREEIEHFAADLGVVHVKVEQTGANAYSIDHSASVFIFNPQGDLRAVLRPPHAPKKLVDALTGLRSLTDA